MTRQEKIAAIVEQVSGKRGVPAADESLFDSGFLDSFALPDMVAALEAEFGITIPDADLSPRKFDSISRIESYMEGRV